MFNRFLEKSKIELKLASNFTELIKEFKTKAYKACFIDID